MFTGLIEYKGVVKSISKGSQSAKLTIDAGPLMQGTQLGDSIATNGVCLTVCTMNGSQFTADVMAETLRASNLGDLSVGSAVNLERAMLPDRRMGGHMVTGHIDGVGSLKSKEQEGHATVLTIQAAPKLLRYVVQKGSIAIDGISLTVVDVTEDSFRVSIIPHTAGETTLLDLKLGGTVNLECDIIGKYVEKLLGLSTPKGDSENGESSFGKSSTLDLNMLAQNGFLD